MLFLGGGREIFEIHGINTSQQVGKVAKKLKVHGSNEKQLEEHFFILERQNAMFPVLKWRGTTQPSFGAQF